MLVGGSVSSPHLISDDCRDFPPALCVTNFASHRDRLVAPFRGTFKGCIVDLLDTDFGQSGSQHRYFKLVDPNGYYIDCCATRHNATSVALVSNVEVVLFFALARPPFGHCSILFVCHEGWLNCPDGANDEPSCTYDSDSNQFYDLGIGFCYSASLCRDLPSAVIDLSVFAQDGLAQLS